ncbi:HesA/MoeB/ThiF family protein [Paraliomyxa miuraensis]|uniref:HesA/MoeB/ThiF family protein n=1 Tax=Paraliomyxa miuraensis TaxID=376150 RepID=UPI00225A5F80|nr:ThiF family adenylyltransferase [Paraliomyxa miuraensis]MCX4245689.1 ThiF family adenylyltransferase [Paraliomyxa miuraensis]
MDANADACFVVVGAGGLGCPALLALSAAGAARAIVIDHDRVEAHNLQRQVLYDVGDVGAAKAEAAARRLAGRGRMAVEPRVHALEPSEVARWVTSLSPTTIVLECTDRPRLKFAINDACVAHGIPLVVGAALGWRGQALAVHVPSPAGPHADRACYRCVYEAPPPDDEIPRCDEAGVVGSGVGHIGMLMAHLALRLAAGDHTVAGQLWAIDLLHVEVRRLAPRRRPGCPAHPRATDLPHDSLAGSANGAGAS